MIPRRTGRRPRMLRLLGRPSRTGVVLAAGRAAGVGAAGLGPPVLPLFPARAPGLGDLPAEAAAAAALATPPAPAVQVDQPAEPRGDRRDERRLDRVGQLVDEPVEDPLGPGAQARDRLADRPAGTRQARLGRPVG